MAILGLDYGEKRIGVALANVEKRLAIPMTVIERAGEKVDMDKVIYLIKQYDVERIVVGLPRSLDGSLGRQAEEVLNFTGVLSRHINIPVDTWDERFSTVAAESLFKDAGMKREKRKGHRDAMAAAIILQGYLDSKKRPKD
jgi:putative Holliday junction resolvase